MSNEADKSSASPTPERMTDMSENAKYVSGLLTVIGDKEMLITFLEMSETLELTDVAQGNISALLALAED